MATIKSSGCYWKNTSSSITRDGYTECAPNETDTEGRTHQSYINKWPAANMLM